MAGNLCFIIYGNNPYNIFAERSGLIQIIDITIKAFI